MDSKLDDFLNTEHASISPHSQQLVTSDDIVSIKTRSTSTRLEIAEVVIDDEGDYVCKATNTAGVASTKASVLVKGTAN